jgi:hypothetical protein
MRRWRHRSRRRWFPGSCSAIVGKDADDFGAALDLAVEAFESVGGMDFRSVLLGKAQVGVHRELPKLEQNPKACGRPKQRPGHNLLERLKTFKVETLRFLTDFDAPFTNNLAEQDPRMMKVKMKISRSFRTLEGAQVFARLRSIVSTARKHGRNILQTLAARPSLIRLALTE